MSEAGSTGKSDTNGSDPHTKKMNELSEQKAEADAEKAKFEAKVKAVEANTAAQKALLGPLTASTFASGEVTLGTGAGNAEATLLSAKAAADAAQQIVAKVNHALNRTSREAPDRDDRPIIVLAGQNKITLDHLRAFEVQQKAVEQAFQNASAAKAYADKLAGKEDTGEADDDAKVLKFTETRGTRGVLTFVNPMSAARLVGGVLPGLVSTAAVGAGAALDFGAKIASYFQSDYKVAEAAVTGVDDDFLAVSVAGGLTNVYYPGRWMKPGTVDSVFAQISDLQKLRDGAELALAESKLAADAAQEDSHLEIAKAYTDAVSAFTDALSSYDTLIVSLAAKDANGIPAAMKIADEKAIAHILETEKPYLLFIRVNSVLGANYAKKTLWRLPWRMPFYVMGGVVANFMLTDSQTGQVKCSGDVAQHGGYYSVSDVADAVSQWIVQRP